MNLNRHFSKEDIQLLSIQMLAIREIQKLISECICSVLIVCGMWGSWAPTTIMMTQPLARSTSSPISALPLLLLPISTHVSIGTSHLNLPRFPSAFRINLEHRPAGVSLSHTLSPPLHPRPNPSWGELSHPCWLPWTHIFFKTFPCNPVR